ncbi:universal stress protein [Streptomyces sp. DSM 40750]|uniref:universal stress protein n=1 Tax=Streptomyces sp. DSM 40750 TaxID=2801030 RepID=UPI00214CF5BC|nr:universal stress protein [Streptomyces sp. DSM 40750]UUU19020.1 universal stress protein [Streptomyces sp. DSM 40750]UUU27638.1 universal stress protein [Streptomyces sp. DSM 40750]
MIRPITVGLDGSPESLAAADWAAREAQRRDLPLHLVHAWIWQPHDVPVAQDLDTQKHWAQRVLREAEEELHGRHPELTVSTEQISETAAEVLLGQAEEAEMLVLGSSGHGAIAGFLLGSVGQQVLARVNSPVAMVRANARSAAKHDGGEIVVGLDDPGDPAAPLLEFAFDAAAARRTALRAVHAPSLPPLYGHGPVVGQLAGQEGGITGQAEKALSDALKPWQEKYPQVPVAHTVDLARPAGVVLQAAAQAGLVVVGRRVHRPALGMRIGPVAHAVLHHAAAPVAVVPHD